ncbi:MAG: TonB-dependent receptor [Rikenellaceae bacterium]|nr:TonB-dependent receptor [Rikenellaceae bacterium]
MKTLIRGIFAVLLLCCGTPLALFAQNTGSVSGVILDAGSNTGLPGAVIEVKLNGSSDVKYYTSGHAGKFTINGLKFGEYSAVVTFLGYDNTELTFNLKRSSHNLGTILIKEANVKIETVVKEAVSTRTIQRGDTLSYNADAFKTAMDADLTSLLNKMPGITVSGNQIEAQGERIRAVYVDGSEFFGGSVEQALQTLPAQAVQRIEVYDRLSETGQATGIADGGGGKVINIITRASMRHSQFGKLHAGYGYEPSADPKITAKHKYTGGGAVNIFDDDRRISMTALANNLNKQNFSSDDVKISSSSNRSNASQNYSVGTQSGIGESQIFGFNLTDKMGPRKNFKFDGTLFFNHTQAKNRYTVDRWYTAPLKIDTMGMISFANPDNYTARARARMDWRISRRHNMVFIPYVQYRDNSSVNVTNGLRWGQQGLRYIPSGNDGWFKGVNASLYTSYRMTFKKPARLFVIDGSVSYYKGWDDRDYWSNGSGKTHKTDLMQATIDTTYTRAMSNTSTLTASGTITYREPIAKHQQLTFIYRPYWSMRDRDYASYSTDYTHAVKDEKRNPYTSSDAVSSFMYHRVGMAYRYARRRNWTTISAFYQYSELSNKDQSVDKPSRHGYHNFIYNATLQWSFDKQNSLRVSLNSDVKAPGMGQLQDYFNVSNSQYISRGNSKLKPYMDRTAFIRYTRSNTEKGRTFMVMFQAKTISNFIGTAILYSPTVEVGEKGDPNAGIPKDPNYKKYNPIQFSQPYNMDGYLRLTGRVSLGLPLQFMKSNINMTAGVDYATTPMMLRVSPDNPETGEVDRIIYTPDWIKGAEKNTIESMNYSFNAVLGSNISENVDFTLAWNGSYNTTKGTLAGFNNNYFMHRASAQIKVVLPLGFTLTGNCLYTEYLGITNGYKDNFVLLNVWLGKKLFRKKLGELQVGVNDLLNQNTSFSRYVSTGYSQVRYNSILGRYFLVKFTYNLRHFSGNKNFRKKNNLSLRLIEDKFEGGNKLPTVLKD